MAKKNMSVIRVAGYARSGIGIRERHNERLNAAYANDSVQLERSHLNVHFKRCEGTYEDALRKLVEQKAVSLRGLRKDATVWNKLVICGQNPLQTGCI